MPVTDHERPLRARWVHVVNLILGAWLVASPVSLGYTDAAMARSDLVAGVLLMLLAALGLWSAAARYTPAFVGLWLVLAPLLFWSTDPVAYANDTLAGAMVLTLTLLVPSGVARAGPERPAGWTYNPSSFAQRAPILVLGLVGFLTARYLAAFQLGYVERIRDPFFGSGADEVLLSSVARAWPVSDAGLGALACLGAIGVAFMGDRHRWRTMPWLVVLFALLIVPLGVFGVVLVALQPIVVGAWCTWCLLTSTAMLLMVPFTVDEVVATAQVLQQSRREGRSLWWTFWLGAPGERADEPTGAEADAPLAAVRGVGAPITLLATTLLGVWLVASPSVLAAAVAFEHVVGALVIAISVIAFAEVARPVRYLHLPVGLWLLLAPSLSALPADPAAWNDRIVGALLILLALPLGRLREHYGRLDLALAWPLRRQPAA